MATNLMMLSNKPALPPAWKDFVDQAVESLKLEIMREWAVAESAGPGAAAAISGRSAAAAVSKRLRSLSAVGKRGARPQATPLDATFDASARTAARVMNLDLLSPVSVVRQANLSQRFRFIDRELTDAARLAQTAEDLFDSRIERADMTPTLGLGSAAVSRGFSLSGTGAGSGLSRILAERFAGLPTATTGGSSGSTIVINRGLKYRLHEVKCVDETNPEWPGSDEIGLGGVAQPPTGNPATIAEFRVGGGFDDGDRKVYSPVKVLHSFSLSSVTYPADFAVFVAMAEKDSNGLSEFIAKLWDAVKDHVGTIMAVIGTAAGAAVGAWIGGTVGTAIAPALGTIIGIVMGAILGALVGWIISTMKDDIFQPQMAALHLPDADATFSGGALVSPTQTLVFEDHGGRYNVKYSWELTR